MRNLVIIGFFDLVLFCGPSLAIEATWSNMEGGDWHQAVNWNGNVPDGVDAVAVFQPQFPRWDATILVTQPVTLASLETTNPAQVSITGSGMLKLAGGTPPTLHVGGGNGGGLILDVPTTLLGDTHVLMVQDVVSTLRFSAPVTGTNVGLIKDGIGTLVFADDNTDLTGTLTINGGRVRFERSFALDVDVRAGQLQIESSGGMLPNSISLSGSVLATSRGATLTTALQLPTESENQLFATPGATFHLSGGTTGVGSLSFVGGGTFNIENFRHTGGISLQDGTVNLLDQSGHSGGTNISSGSFVVTTGGSLVDTGAIWVRESGELVISESAGADPVAHSVSSQSVELDGGTLHLKENIDPTSALSLTSTGGVIALSNVASFDAGGSLVLDFGAMPAGSNMRLGSVGTSSLAAELALLPAADGALKFGGSLGTLVVSNVIADHDAQVTSVEQSVSGITRLFAENTYTGSTVVSSGILQVNHPFALGSSDTGTIVTGGLLQLDVESSEPITVLEGEVVLQSVGPSSGDLQIQGGKVSLETSESEYQGNFTMSGGELFIDATGGLFALPGLQLLNSGTAAIAFPPRTIDIYIADGITGDGNVSFSMGNSNELYVDSNLSHNGGVSYLGAANNVVHLNAASRYNGETIIDQGTVRLNHADGLGSAEGRTVVQGGVLRVRVPTQEPIVIEKGGEVIMEPGAQPQFTEITLVGGLFRVTSDTVVHTPIRLQPGESEVRASSTLAGGVTGQGNLTILANSGQLFVDGLPIAHDGSFALDGGSIYLKTANTYQGTTLIKGGDIYLDHAAGFGRADNFVRIENQNGTVFLNEIPVNDFVIETGTLRLNNADRPYVGTVKLTGGAIAGVGTFQGVVELLGDLGNGIGGGTFRGDIRGHGPVGFSGNTQLNTANSFTGLATIGSGTVDINDPVALGSTDQGTIVGRGTLNVNVPTDEPLMLASHGTINLHEQLANLPVSVPGSQGTIAIHVPSQYEDAPTMFDTTLVVNADTTLGGLTLRGESGGVAISPGSTLQVTNGALNLLAGEVQGRLVVDGAIRKFGSGRAALDNLTGYAGEVEVHRGTFVLQDANNGDDTSYSVGLKSARYASVLLDTDSNNGNFRYDHNISLRGAQGNIYGPALAASGIIGSQTATLTGTLDLGEGGATIGGRAFRLELEGDVVGGSFSILDGLSVRLTGGPKSYVGETQIRDGVMIVDGAATVENLSRIVVHDQGFVHLSYGADTQELNRISDNIPIVANGGSLTIHSAENARATEQLGPLTLNQGHFEIEADTSDLAMASLSRTPYATVFFETDSSNGAPGTIRFLEDAPLEHGILGAWAIARDGNTTSFATIGPDGVVPLTEFITDVANATPEANLQLQDSAVLTSNLHVNALTFASSSSVLDLDGHTLNVESGGVLSGTIINGQITAGSGGDAELFLGSRVSADIVDNGNGRVSVVGGGSYEGNNSYSGATVVNGGTLTLRSETALPQGTELIMNGGDLWIEIAPAEPHRLDKFVLRGGAETLARGAAIKFDAELIELYDGGIRSGVQFVGGGTMIKDSPGTVIFDSNHPDYTGEIIVRDGRIEMQNLGTGSIRVDGGVLATRSDDILDNPITLLGGALATSAAAFNGMIDILGPADIINEGSGEISGMIRGNQPLTFESVTDPQRPFLISGDNSLYSGDVFVNSGTLRVERGSSIGSGTISVNFGGRLELGSVTTDNNLNIQGGEILSREAPAEITGVVSVQSTAYVGAELDDRGLVISGAVELADGSRLYKVGDADLSITGEIGVTGTAEMVLPQGAVNVSGVLTPRTDNAVLNIIGLGFEQLDLSLQVPDGTTLNVQQNGGATRLQVGEGQYVGGNGVVGNDLEFSEGATLQPGESVGELTGAGNVIWGVAANYQWEINDAHSSKGVVNGKGADLLLVGDTLEITAFNESPVSIGVASIDGVGQLAALENFDPRENYHWTLASATKVEGFDSSRIELDVTSFLATNEIAPGAEFDVELINNELILNYDASITIDLNGDSSVTVDDIDLLVGEIVAGGTRFDLSRDGNVNEDDLTVWLSKAGVHLGFDGAVLSGDANLDGAVDAADLNVVGLHWQQGVFAWSSGDFTADGIVDAADLNRIGRNWLADVTTPAAAVPEPGVCGLSLLVLVACLSRFALGTTPRR